LPNSSGESISPETRINEHWLFHGTGFYVLLSGTVGDPKAMFDEKEISEA
jgi:hypothetical protein